MSQPPKTYLIIGSALLDTSDMIADELGRVEWRHGRVITGDDHGVNAEVARLAALRHLPCQVVTANRRPTNGHAPYMRVIVDTRLPRPERLRLRDQFMVQLADYVITIGDHACRRYAEASGKRFVYSV